MSSCIRSVEPPGQLAPLPLYLGGVTPCLLARSLCTSSIQEVYSPIFYSLLRHVGIQIQFGLSALYSYALSFGLGARFRLGVRFRLGACFRLDATRMK